MFSLQEGELSDTEEESKEAGGKVGERRKNHQSMGAGVGNAWLS